MLIGEDTEVLDTGDVLSIFLRGALGARGRKRARRARNFLTGHRGFLSASTLLGAAGVAWGLYDTYKANAPAAAASPATGPAPSGPVMPPPVPGAVVAPASPPPESTLPVDVLRVIRLAVSAARADGQLSAQERAVILEHARAAGVEPAVEHELGASRPLSEIVGGVHEDLRKQDLYVLAYTIVRADEGVSGAERIYLAQLAHQLGLDAATVARLEQETAANIDAAPDVAAADTEPSSP